MRLRTTLPLIALIGLAACSGKQQAADNGIAANTSAMNEQQVAQAEHRAPNADTVMAQRWQALFGDPSKLTAALDDMGYKLGSYAASGAGYTATSPEQTLPTAEPTPPATVKTSAVVTSPAADHVQTITLTFDTHVTEPDSSRAREILGFPRQIVTGVLQRFEVGPGDPVVSALTQYNSGTISRYGSTITVDTKPGNGDRFADQHIVVTISQTGAAGAAH